MAILRSGLKGEPVRRLQQVLGVKADGEFGPQTEAALKKWQQGHGLAADGIAGPDTFMMMGLWELVLLDRGTKGEAVKKLQSKLGVPTDGVFGTGTAQAVREYQKTCGISADGIAGPATLARLEIYREITADVIHKSEMPADKQSAAEKPVPAAAVAHAPAGQPAPHIHAAAATAPPGRSIWDTITKIFK